MITMPNYNKKFLYYSLKFGVILGYLRSYNRSCFQADVALQPLKTQAIQFKYLNR